MGSKTALRKSLDRQASALWWWRYYGPDPVTAKRHCDDLGSRHGILAGRVEDWEALPEISRAYTQVTADLEETARLFETARYGGAEAAARCFGTPEVCEAAAERANRALDRVRGLLNRSPRPRRKR